MSVGLASLALQAALYTRLSSDGTLTALASVFDEPPEGNAFPYVLVGDVEETQNNRMGGKVGRTCVATIHAWTEGRGMKSLQQILGRVDALLDNYLALSVTGYGVELVNFDSNTLERVDVIGAPLRHGITRYRVDLLEN